ncbi:MAG TPA: tetratricopeptide repeat protein, partial [Candidatus Obscuribacter sp.]|nr:tetratricopeptide repeat protein [Candidatus Obscuribacter sp.]
MLRRISLPLNLLIALGLTFSFAQAQALTGTQLSLIKLMNTSPVTVDLRSVGDVIIQLRRKVTDNPHDGNLRLRLGTYLYLAGDLQGAASEMKRAVAINPEDYLAHIMLARVLDLSMDEASAEL